MVESAALEKVVLGSSATITSENPHGFYVVPPLAQLGMIGGAVHRAVWIMSQQQIDLKNLLTKYSRTLWEFYTKNGNPQSTEEKIKLLETEVWACTIPGSREEILQYLEFDYLCDINALDDDDFKAYRV